MADDTPVLDALRVDQIRTFLTVEAAADLVANPPGHQNPRRRRLALGLACALLLGGVLVVATALAGGPGPTRTPPAVAVETRHEWVTVRLLDSSAPATQVVDELETGGISAVLADPAVPGMRTVGGVTFLGDPGQGRPEGVAPGGVAGISFAIPLPPGVHPDDVADPEVRAAIDAHMEQIGVRTLPDGSLQFRRGRAITVVVSVWP